MGTLFRTFLSTLIRHGHLEVRDRRRDHPGVRRSDRSKTRGPARRSGGRAGVDLRSHPRDGRALHGRPPDRHQGRSLRRPGAGRAEHIARSAARGGSSCWRTPASRRGGFASATTACTPSRTSPITTTSMSGSTTCSSIRTGNIPAPISSIPARRSRRRNSPRSGISPPSCWSRTDHSVLDIGCGFGGMGLYLAEHRRRARDRRHPVARAARRRGEARDRRRPCRSRQLPFAGLSRRHRTLRPHRFGRHVRTCRRRRL